MKTAKKTAKTETERPVKEPAHETGAAAGAPARCDHAPLVKVSVWTKGVDADGFATMTVPHDSGILYDRDVYRIALSLSDSVPPPLGPAVVDLARTMCDMNAKACMAADDDLCAAVTEERGTKEFRLGIETVARCGDRETSVSIEARLYWGPLSDCIEEGTL